MIVCDLCLYKIPIKELRPKVTVNTEYACKAWQSVEIDLCEKCRKELQESISRASAEFYQKKIHLLE